MPRVSVAKASLLSLELRDPHGFGDEPKGWAVVKQERCCVLKATTAHQSRLVVWEQKKVM